MKRSVLSLWVLMVLGVVSGCGGPLTFVVGVTPGDQRLEPTVVQSEDGARGKRVAIIDVSGVIANARVGGGLLGGGENPVALLHEQLAAAAADKKVGAVVLRINSPGGGVTASDAMYRSVQRFRERTGKPVVAVFMDVAASGGYYLGCAADEIVAYPSSVTGSIGVIFQTVQFEPALARLGIATEALVSGPNKEAGSPLSEMTDGQRETLQALVDDFYEAFVAVVRDARPGISDEHFADATDGRVLSGVDAHAWGLVDHLGDVDTAVARAKALAGLGAADWVVYHRPLTYAATPYAPAASGGGGVPRAGGGGSVVGQQFNVLNVDGAGGLLPANASAGFYYLWMGP